MIELRREIDLYFAQAIVPFVHDLNQFSVFHSGIGFYDLPGEDTPSSGNEWDGGILDHYSP